MSEEGKQLVQRWVDAWNQGTNLEVIDQIFAQDWVDRNPVPGGPQGGIEGAAHFVRLFRQSFSDIHLEIDLLLGENHWVVFRWIATARHTGDFLGVTPAGKKVRFSGITAHRVADHRFAESVAEIDLLGLLEQLQAE